MQRSILVKGIIIFFLGLALLIPMTMIKGIIFERQNLRYQARSDIARSWSDSQTVFGPYLVVPYSKRIQRKIYDKDKDKFYVEQQVSDHILYFLPESLKVSGRLETEERYRGIYRFPVYHSDLSISGNFKLPKDFGLKKSTGEILWGEAFLALGITDIRGIQNNLNLSWDGRELEFLPGADGRIQPAGIRALTGSLIGKEDKSIPFQFKLKLFGMEGLRFSPLGKTTNINLDSTWPHPKFVGRFLPRERKVTKEGFEANWQTTHFSTNSPQLLNYCALGNCRTLLNQTLGVELFQPVDVYRLGERSLKYAILFVVLSFASFFFFELLKNLSIHPIQYGLVGAALALFYLLLVSFSEHASFSLSYVIAAAASVSLLTFYLCYVLKSLGRGFSFGVGLASLYGVLYMLLQTEDRGLLVGSLLLFGLLAALMIGTRRIDWYDIGRGAPNSE